MSSWKPYNVSPYFRLTTSHLNVLNYVRDNPGCNKYEAAAAGTRNSRRDPSKQYYLVNTLIRQGYLLAFSGKGSSYALYAAEDYSLQIGDTRIFIDADDATEVAFRDKINTGDMMALGIFADWLEEQGDARSVLIQDYLKNQE